MRFPNQSDPLCVRRTQFWRKMRGMLCTAFSIELVLVFDDKNGTGGIKLIWKTRKIETNVDGIHFS